MDEVVIANRLERGRVSYAKRAWLDAYESLSLADDGDSLEAEDLELLARSAYMLGRDDEYVRGLKHAHHAHLDAGEVPSAARCTWWIGHNLLFRGETARANGWFGRGERLLEREGGECVENGYLLIPALLRAGASGDARAEYATATEAAAIGERYDDLDLVTIARMGQGHALLRKGRTEEGFRLVDETMVAVTTGELSPIVAGIVYCNTIAICQEAHEVRRAREWTNALTEWCDRQPDMVAHTGVCLVHRAEVMQLQGDWPAALEEVQRAGERLRQGVLNQRRAGSALYREGEIQRLQGEYAAAEEAYRAASRLGYEPQPGLALLRLAQGNGPLPPPRSGAWWTRPTRPSSVLGCCRPASRSCWPWATSRKRASPLASSIQSRKRTQATCCERWPPKRVAPWCSPKATPGAHWARCAAR